MPFAQRAKPLTIPLNYDMHDRGNDGTLVPIAYFSSLGWHVSAELDKWQQQPLTYWPSISLFLSLDILMEEK